MKRYDNDIAVAGIFTFVLLFLLSALIFLFIGYGIDRITAIAAKMFISTAAASQLRYDTVNLMLLAFRAEPIILFISIGINLITNELRVQSGMADVGTMIIASVEMITMTLIIIVFTLFGGYGLDQVTGFVNHQIVTNPDLDLFAAVQYIAPGFYGIMFLILCGIVVQFVMTCVKTVDYTGYSS